MEALIWYYGISWCRWSGYSNSIDAIGIGLSTFTSGFSSLLIKVVIMQIQL